MTSQSLQARKIMDQHADALDKRYSYIACCSFDFKWQMQLLQDQRNHNVTLYISEALECSQQPQHQWQIINAIVARSKNHNVTLYISEALE